MRIVVATGLNTGAAEYQNMGDVAMLQVAVARLLRLWPNACIEVLTNSRSDLARYCPSAKPLPRASCTCWVGITFSWDSFISSYPSGLQFDLAP